MFREDERWYFLNLSDSEGREIQKGSREAK